QMLAAAETARCREFIEALPEGFDTLVGDRGVMLSGGQRQRLAIARDLMKDRTVIAIAHRLSTLRRFDRIIVMDRGRIIDDGTPSALARRPGPYRDLLDKQHMDRELA